MEFRDRRHAGRLLAARLLALGGAHPVVIAIPRGGVPVGFEIARALQAPLDILAVRKLGAPTNPEFGVGAIAEDGTAVLDSSDARRAGMTPALLTATVERETLELRRRVVRYREGRAPVEVAGRTVILADDGLATGLTALTAVRALRRRDPARIVLAVPVGSPEAIDRLRAEIDEIACLTIPRELVSVGQSFAEFAPVTDRAVVALLDAAGATADPAAGVHAPMPPTGPAS